jgi:hypothetical protein
MRNPIFMGLLIPGARGDPDANGDGFEIRNLFRDDSNPIVKDGLSISHPGSEP